MIEKCLLPGQALAVGKAEYKAIIEKRLRIYCLFNDAIMEVTWGLKVLMKSLLPDLANGDCLPMCKGMKFVLDHHGIDVKPDMVNRQIIEVTCSVYECDFCVNKFAETLCRGGECLRNLSKINTEHWDYLKLATALKLVCYPQEKVNLGRSPELLSLDEAKTLVRDAHLYTDNLHKNTFLSIYKEIMWARGVRTKALKLLRTLVMEASGRAKTSTHLGHGGKWSD